MHWDRRAETSGGVIMAELMAEGREEGIRRATVSDMQDLYWLYRKSFPEALRFQIPFSYAQKWFNFLLTTKTAEVYVYCIHGEIAGSVVLLTDLAAYDEERKRNHPPFWIRGLTVATSPKIIKEFLAKGIIRFVGQFRGRSPRQKNPQNGTTWADMLAISHAHRGKRLAKELLRFIEYRTVELQRPAIGSFVRAKNKASIRAFVSAGWERTGQDPYGFDYGKKF